MTVATIDKCIADKTEMPGAKERLETQRASDEAATKKGTMRIKFRQGMCRTGASYERGDEADWRADEAERLIEAGYAVPVPQDKKRTATVTPPERRG